MGSKHFAVGNQLAFFGFVDNNAFLTGSSTTPPSNGNLSGMLRLQGIKQATPGLPEGTDVSVQGDDDVVGTMSFQPDSTPAFVATFGVGDLTTAARMQSTLTESIAGIDFGVLQPEDPGFNNGTLILQSRAVSQDDSNKGVEIWHGFLFPLVVAQPLSRESFNYREAADFRIKFTAQKAGHKPWGVTIAEGDLGTTAASIIEFRSPYPITMDRITGNGSTDSFTLSKAVAATSNVAVYNQTQLLTHGSGITATAGSKTLAFSSPPAPGNKVIVIYGFTP